MNMPPRVLDSIVPSADRRPTVIRPTVRDRDQLRGWGLSM